MTLEGSTVLHFSSTFLGESPPPRPRACFGRGLLVEKIVGLADTLSPIALIGPGGIGKTSVVLDVLHHRRIKERFGDNRRFIRCDEFPASRANFLRRLSKVIGACVENPEDLVPLRSFLSSKEMLIVLDNAESILDPQGAEGKEIYRVVEELGRFDNICLTITSRITTVPPDCETIEVSSLSMGAAHDTFYRIYKHGGRSESVNDILKQLEFHPLSVTLLAAVAHQNKWDGCRLAREWARRKTGVLRTERNNSLAAAIELSLTSPMFKELGPDARELLGVIAFFPQGVDENNLDWLFPAISNIRAIFNKFCILSLAHRSSSFVTMLAPLRDYLRPIDPSQSPLLSATKGLYFTRLSVKVYPYTPAFGATQWVVSEDVNIEHLLDVFTSIDTNSEDIWEACADFAKHLHWHKPRRTILRSKIEWLPDDHHSKPRCLLWLSQLLGSIGNDAEQKSILLHVLTLQRKEGNDYQIARTLLDLSRVNRFLGLVEEGILQAKEALKIMERVSGNSDRARCLASLAFLLHHNKELDAAREAASRAIDLFGKGQELKICQCYRILGKIYSSKGEREKAIHHFEVALGIASSSKSQDMEFWIHHSMAELFFNEDMLDNAQSHIVQAKLRAVGDTYRLGHAMQMQAWIWYGQCKFRDAMSEAGRASEIFEKLGAAKDLEDSRTLLWSIERAVKSQAIPGGSHVHSGGELLVTMGSFTR